MVESTVSDKQKRINEACESIKVMARGTTLTHIALAEILGAPNRTGEYYSMVSRLRKQLERDYSIFLGTSTRIGYVIAEPGTEIDIPNNQCDKATRQYKRAVRRMQHIDIDKITDDQLRQRTIRIAQDRANTIGLMRLGSTGAGKMLPSQQ